MSENEDRIGASYEPPTAEEREQMQAPRVEVDDEDRLFTAEELRERVQRVVDARDRIDEREKQAEIRRQQTRRETGLHLAVQWTAHAPGVSKPGTLFGVADLMVQYIETGRKPTETEVKRAWKPYR